MRNWEEDKKSRRSKVGSSNFKEKARRFGGLFLFRRVRRCEGALPLLIAKGAEGYEEAVQRDDGIEMLLKIDGDGDDIDYDEDKPRRHHLPAEQVLRDETQGGADGVKPGDRTVSV